jgi:hypothetical protein
MNPVDSLDARDDWPAVDLPAEKYWSESYAFWAWDERNDMTIYAHFQRHPDKPSIWRAYATVMRENGVYACHSYGAQHSPFGPGFAGCSIAIERPHGLWRLQVDGAAQFQTYAQHESSCITDGPATPIRIDVLLSLISPPWDLPHGSADASKIMPMHREQTGHVSGTLELGKERFIVDCPGANDHSRGVRDTSNLKDGGFYFNAVFPSGKSLTAIKMGFEVSSGQLGYLANGDGSVLQATRIVAPDARWPEVGQAGRFIVEAAGETANATFEPTVRRVLLTMIPPSYEHIGLKNGCATDLYYCDHTCRVMLGGEEGWGSWEVARRGGTP